MTLHGGMTNWTMDFMLPAKCHAFSNFALHLGMKSCLQLPHKDHASRHKDHASSFLSCLGVIHSAPQQRSCLQRHYVMSPQAWSHVSIGMLSCLHVIHPWNVMPTCNTMCHASGGMIFCAWKHDLQSWCITGRHDIILCHIYHKCP